jgi:hypothetical protein
MMPSPLSEYPELDTLAAYIRQHGLVISVGPAHPAFETLDGAIVEIAAHGQLSIKLTVFDEYRDTRGGNPLLLLVLIAMEFGELDDAAGVADWARVQCLDVADEVTQQTYDDNMRAKLAFIEIYGAIPEVITDLDWQLNAGAAQALRRMGS